MDRGKDILLINRDPAFLEHLAGVLQSCDFKAHTASEMREALSILSNNPVTLIICDKKIKDISGYDFLRFIKNDPLREKIPFIFLVPINDQGHAVKAFELGAEDYLIYPIDPENLIGRIQETLSRSLYKDKKDNNDKKVATPEIPGQPAAQIHPVQETSQGQHKERRRFERVPVANRRIDVSRDGVIWLPGMVKNFSYQGLFVETSLFGKPNMRLMLRFRLANGMFVAYGSIRHISFDDFQKPAGIGIDVEEDETWRGIYSDLDAQKDLAQEIKLAEQILEKTILLSTSPAEDSKSDLLGVQQLQQAAEKKKTSYDIRFYHSLIGKQLDNYRVISLIGAGSMGGVLLGWDVALERDVALKIISFELSSKETFRELFITEARVVSRLNHLNIAQIYYISNSNDILYYTMEFIDGITLKQILLNKGNLNSLKGLDYLITVCEALDFVYQSSIVHRDIKPANIMVNNRGIIKIVDFGVAKANDSKKSGFDKNLLMGSPLYMSPEQIAGLSLDHRSDMYSLGATFYHVFCGRPPFESEDVKEILEHHLSTPLPPIREKNPKVAPAIAKVIEKMLAKDPNDRYKDFQVVVNELRMLRTRAIEAKRQSKRAEK